MATPDQTPVAGTPHHANSAMDFIAQTLFPEPANPPTEPVAQPPVQPAEPVQPTMPTPAPAPTPVPPPAPQPVVPAPASTPQPAPQPAPQPVNYADRYNPAGANPDPLASLQELPALAPEAQIVQPQNMSDQQNHAWAGLRAQANANRKAAEENLRKYNELVAQTRKFQDERKGFGEQLNAKDKEIENLRNEIGRIDLSRSPEFREKYEAPIFSVQDEIASTLVANGVSQADAEELSSQVISANPDELPGLIQQFPTHVQGILALKSQEAGRLFEARQHALDDWKTSQEGLAAVANRGSALIEAQRRDALATQAIETLRSMPIEQKVPAYQVTDPTFVADREKHEAEFKAWIQEAPVEQQYAAMLEGFMAPKTYEMLAEYARENAELKQALYNHTRANPRVTPSHSTFSAPTPAPAPTQQPTQRANGFTVQEAPGVSANSLVKDMFRQGGLLPPGM